MTENAKIEIDTNSARQFAALKTVKVPSPEVMRTEIYPTGRFNLVNET